MAQLTIHDDDDDDDFETDVDDDGTAPCPYCQRPTYEDAPQCPHCGEYFSEEDAPTKKKPWWVILGLLLAGLMAIFWAMGH